MNSRDINQLVRLLDVAGITLDRAVKCPPGEDRITLVEIAHDDAEMALGFLDGGPAGPVYARICVDEACHRLASARGQVGEAHRDGLLSTAMVKIREAKREVMINLATGQQQGATA